MTTMPDQRESQNESRVVCWLRGRNYYTATTVYLAGTLMVMIAADYVLPVGGLTVLR